MTAVGSIFFDFNLPNAATWFYLSLLLTIALFFKFSRLLSVRNWDVLTIFVLVPGLLILQEGRTRVPVLEQSPALAAARLVAAGGQAAVIPTLGLEEASTLIGASLPVVLPLPASLWLGYLWLMCGSVYFLVRCLFDLALVQRPALSPNLNFAGLAWLAGALFVCLVAVAVRKPDGQPAIVGKRSVAVKETQRRAEDLVKQEIALEEVSGINTSFWVDRTLAILCHLAIVAGLVLIGCRHFQDATAGMAAATFYLLLPYTAYHVEQLHHVWPTAVLIWAIAVYRKPMLAGLLLGLAAGTVYFPVLLFPLWFSFYWRRGAGRFTAGFALSATVCLAIIGLILYMNGELVPSLHTALTQSDWQPWREPSPGTQGFWTGIAWAWVYRLPVFIAYLAFLATTTFWPIPKNLAHLLALSAALLVGVQLWYADQGGVYILWYLPLLLLLVFRPNLSDRQPPSLRRERDWVARFGRALVRGAVRLLRLPEPALPVR